MRCCKGLLRGASIEVEQIAQKRLLSTLMRTFVARIAVTVTIEPMCDAPVAFVLVIAILFARRVGGFGYGRLRRATDDLIQFAAIQPHTAALRAIVDFDSLAHGHQQIRGGASWAFHFASLLFAFDEAIVKEEMLPKNMCFWAL
jgi:hypothetical protein